MISEALQRNPRLAQWAEIADALAEIAEGERGPSEVSQALGMGSFERSDLTRFFMFEMPANASVYLSASGRLGGETYDNIAGFYRAIGSDPGTNADHISTLLALLAAVLNAEAAASGEGPDRKARSEAIRRSRAVLMNSHLLSWFPAYLLRASELAPPSIAPWAEVAWQLSIDLEEDLGHISLGPVAAAGRAELPDKDNFDVVEWVLAPAKSGMVISLSDLSQIAQAANIGKRVGGRRFVLSNLLALDRSNVSSLLAQEAERQSRTFGRHSESFPILESWSQRAQTTSRALEENFS